MTDRLTALTDEARALHSESVDYALEQSKLAQKQVQLGFDTARASMELTRDLQQAAIDHATKAWRTDSDKA